MTTHPAHNGASNLGRPDMLIASCQQGLQQCSALLAALTPEDYVLSSAGAASIGAHVRHIIDRYQCFLTGLAAGRVDYDARDRQQALEDSPRAAAKALAAIRHQLDGLGPLDRPLLIRESVQVHGPCAEASSSLERELLSLIGHTTHHLAMIAMLARPRGYQLDDNFGKAASTIIHERQSAAN